MGVSGCEKRMRDNPDLYRNLLHEEHDPELVEAIDKGKSI